VRIDRIDIIRINNPFKEPFETSFVRFEVRDALLVKIYSEGAFGYGECKAFHAPLYNAEDNGTCLHILKHILAPRILGETLDGPEDFLRRVAFVRGNRLAIAAIENALWDLRVKATGKSLKTLIGGTRDEVEAGISLGIEPTIGALLAKIERHQAEGYHRIKIKIKPGKDLQVVREVRRHYPDITLTVDANSAYTLADLDLFKAMDEFNLSYIEQPLGEDDIVDHAVLQKAIGTRICLDESITSFEDARKAIGLGSAQVINIKSSRCGGIHEAIRIHDLCMEHGIPVWCGGMTETGIGRVQNISMASLANFTLANDITPARRFFAEDITMPMVDITPRCTLRVPDEHNGVQYTVDEAAIERMMVSREVLRR